MTTATKSKRRRTRHQAKRPPMTPEQAISFERFSLANAAMVMRQLHCKCNPYEDVFTYGRWKAQGYQVRRGEHGIHIPTISTTHPPVELDNDGEEVQPQPRARKLFHNSVVFCRCQVDRSNGHSSAQQSLDLA